MKLRAEQDARSYSESAAAALAANTTTVVELVEDHLAHIARHDGTVSAFIHVMADEAGQQAAMLDALDPDSRGPLHGMILSVKDIIDVAGTSTTCGSHSRLDRPAECDALLVERLRKAGAVIIGKANCHEFAFGGPAFDLPFPPARNPWDSDLFPGGSSSGSGVSVAAGFCHASIGSDTAGSIRLPSSHCGIVGLKCSRDSVPLDGVTPLSPSLDSVGPMARSVADCAAIYEVMASKEATSTNADSPLCLPCPKKHGWLASSVSRMSLRHIRKPATPSGLAASNSARYRCRLSRRSTQPAPWL
ncbi:amidase [Mesorhizobium sediminum]|nr:amidase [Mesorhizobium sediminum]